MNCRKRDLYDRWHIRRILLMDLVLPLQLNQASPQRVAVVRALPGLGDLLCVVPALRALRAALPTAEIALIGLPIAQAFVDRFRTYVDRWLEFPGYPGIPEVPLAPQKVVAFLTAVQAQPLDCVLQLHGNGSVMNGFAMLLGARRTAGFYLPGCCCPDRSSFLPYPDHLPEIRRHLQLLDRLGVPLQGEQLEFPLTDADWRAGSAIVPTDGLTQPYVCIHPGASVSDRRWSAAQFAQVADALASRGYAIVLTGTEAEAHLTQSVAEAMRYPAIDLAGKTNLGAVAVLLKQAALLVCNDTGVSHLAAALRTKSVVIFSNSDPQRWAPLDRQRHRIVNGGENVVDQVVKQAIDLLEREYAYAS